MMDQMVENRAKRIATDRVVWIVAAYYSNQNYDKPNP